MREKTTSHLLDEDVHWDVDGGTSNQGRRRPGQGRHPVTKITAHPLKAAIVVHVSEAGTDERKVIPVDLIIRGGSVRSAAMELRGRHQELLGSTPVGTIERILSEISGRHGDSGDLMEQWETESSPGSRPSSRGFISAEDVGVSIKKLDEYMELLYEDLPQKVESIRNLALLAREPAAMKVLLENGSLLSAVIRVLHEEGKKSLDLSVQVFSLFYCISNFPDYHSLLTQNKVGDACFKALEREIVRFQVWCDDFRRRQETQGSTGSVEDGTRKFLAMSKKQDRLILLACRILLNLSVNLTIEVKMVKRGIVDLIGDILDMQKNRASVVYQNQNAGPYYGTLDDLTLVLLDLLKKISVFRENRKRLAENADIITDFLMHMVVRQEQPPIVSAAISVLSNLLHDITFRAHLRDHLSALPPLISFMQESHGDIHYSILRLLYLISCDEQSNKDFTGTEAIPVTMRLLLEHPSSRLPVELMAFVCNLSTDTNNAEIICGEKGDNSVGIGLKLLMRRALKTLDPLVWKLLRILCTGTNAEKSDMKMAFLPFVEDMAKVLVKKTNDSSSTTPEGKALIVEILGIFAQMTIPEFDFMKFAKTYSLLDILVDNLKPCLIQGGYSIAFSGGDDDDLPMPPQVQHDDDIALECINLLGTMLQCDADMGSVIAQHVAWKGSASGDVSLVQIVVKLLLSKTTDQEFTLQVLFVIYQCLLHEELRSLLLHECPQIVPYLMELTSGEVATDSESIQSLCDTCLDMIADDTGSASAGNGSDILAAEIQRQRFIEGNREWLEYVGVGVEGQ